MSFLDAFDFLGSLGDYGMGEFGGDFPTFDFNVPSYEASDLAQGAAGYGGGGYPEFYDTSTGQFVDQGGQPFDMGGFGEATQPGGVYGAERPPGYEGQGAPPGPGLFAKGGTLGAGGPADQFLTGPLGRSLVPLLGGAAAMGVGRAIAGSPPRLNMPAFTPSASTMAGENSILNAYRGGVDTSLPEALQFGVGGQRDIARNLVGQIGAEKPYFDPVHEAIQREIMSVLSGSGVSPTTTMRQQREALALQNQLYQQLGPDYAVTTAGQDALNKIQQRHNAEQFDERRATVLGYAPQEQSRAQFAYAAPTARMGQQQNILQSIAPTQPLLNYGGVDRANLYNTQLQGQQALTGFQAQTQNQRDLATGIGQLGGRVAESITRPPNPFDEYYRNILAGAGSGGQP